MSALTPSYLCSRSEIEELFQKIIKSEEEEPMAVDSGECEYVVEEWMDSIRRYMNINRGTMDQMILSLVGMERQIMQLKDQIDAKNKEMMNKTYDGPVIQGRQNQWPSSSMSPSSASGPVIQGNMGEWPSSSTSPGSAGSSGPVIKGNMGQGWSSGSMSPGSAGPVSVSKTTFAFKSPKRNEEPMTVDLVVASQPQLTASREHVHYNLALNLQMWEKGEKRYFRGMAPPPRSPDFEGEEAYAEPSWQTPRSVFYKDDYQVKRLFPDS